MNKILSKILFVLMLSFTPSVIFAGTLLILGDSLSAGYNMMAHQAWPHLLPDVLKQRGHDIAVVNASISGDTTANGLQRLPKLLERHQPTMVLIALGGNDGLRGFPIQKIETNLQTMTDLVKHQQALPILMDIRVPPNYGKRYSEAFANIFLQIKQKSNVVLLPFFLEFIITKEGFMLADGIHPSIDAQPWIANYMADTLINAGVFAAAHQSSQQSPTSSSAE